MDQLLLGLGVVALGGSALYVGSAYGLVTPLLEPLRERLGGAAASPHALRGALLAYAASSDRSGAGAGARGDHKDYARIVALLYSWTELVSLGVLPGTGSSGGGGGKGKSGGPAEPVDEVAVLQETLSAAGVDPADAEFSRALLPSMRHIVHGLALERDALVCAEVLRETPFDEKNPVHGALLDTLWDLLMPGVEREGSSSSSAGARASASWGSIGFQGKDPVTDLRGMGMLGVLQLVHFARTAAGRRVLGWSRPPPGASEVKFFPFACGGIQVTSLVVGLATERRLGSVLLDGELREGTGAGGAEGEKAVSLMRSLVKDAGISFEGAWQSIELLNDVYCEIFTLVGEQWHRENPPTVMSWPGIFKDVEGRVSEGASTTGAERLEIRWRRGS
jgi:hypothetical protein